MVWNHTWLLVAPEVDYFFGGMVVLLILAGWNFATFAEQNGGLDLSPGRFLRYAWKMALPTVAVLIALAPFRQHNPLTLQMVLLVGNLVDGKSEAYWYVEAVVQMCLVLALLFSWRGLRRQFQARPLTASLLFYACALVFSVAWNALWRRSGTSWVPMPVIWGFALGMTLYALMEYGKPRLGGFVRPLAVACVIGGGALEFGVAGAQFWYLLAAAIVLLWGGRVRLSALGDHLCNVVAQATFTIYLLHTPVMVVLLRVLDNCEYSAVLRSYDCSAHPSMLLLWLPTMAGCVGLWMLRTALVRAFQIRKLGLSQAV